MKIQLHLLEFFMFQEMQIKTKTSQDF